jgi:hypothetical protein
MSNPSGYQTAAQVTASLGAYLPLAGGTITGALTVNGGATLGATAATAGVNVGSSAATVSTTIGLVGAVGGYRQMVSYSGANARWSLALADNAAETGSNAGSNFNLTCYADGGATLSSPFSITRSNGMATFTSASNYLRLAAPTQPSYALYDSGTLTLRGSVYWQQSSGQLGFSHAYSGATAFINQSGQFQTATFYNSTATAYMAGGTLWSNTSDARIKTVRGAYEAGLAQLRKLNSVRYVYKGNDTPDERLNEPDFQVDEHTVRRGRESATAPYPASQRYEVAAKAQEFVGFVAQDLEKVCPDMVTARKGFIDGKPVDDLRDINLSNLIHVLVNAVKELADRVEQLEGAR